MSSNDPTDRPLLVTAATAVMTIAGALVILTGLVSLFARGSSAAEVGDPLRWAFVVAPVILLPVGVVDLVAARAALGGTPWARTAGAASAIVLALFGLFALGADATAGEFLLTTGWIVANGFVVYALVVSGAWFASRA